MQQPQKAGISFGLTSGVITTLGVMIGLDAATSLRLAVIGGILTVAISDAFSDALGMHVSQESNENNNHDEVWQATFATFFSKLIIALTFLIPVLLLNLQTAILVNIIYGLLLISASSYLLAKSRKESPLNVIAEHLTITVIVIAITYYAGKLIALYL